MRPYESTLFIISGLAGRDKRFRLRFHRYASCREMFLACERFVLIPSIWIYHTPITYDQASDICIISNHPTHSQPLIVDSEDKDGRCGAIQVSRFDQGFDQGSIFDRLFQELQVAYGMEGSMYVTFKSKTYPSHNNNNFFKISLQDQ